MRNCYIYTNHIKDVDIPIYIYHRYALVFFVNLPRLCEEQWRVAKAFGHLAKGAWLAACLVDKKLPRCSLEALKQSRICCKIKRKSTEYDTPNILYI